MQYASPFTGPCWSLLKVQHWPKAAVYTTRTWSKVKRPFAFLIIQTEFITYHEDIPMQTYWGGNIAAKCPVTEVNQSGCLLSAWRREYIQFPKSCVLWFPEYRAMDNAAKRKALPRELSLRGGAIWWLVRVLIATRTPSAADTNIQRGDTHQKDNCLHVRRRPTAEHVHLTEGPPGHLTHGAYRVQ
jgi:hypothetical protein